MMPAVNVIAPNEHLHIQLWLEPITAMHLDPIPNGSFVPESDPVIVAAIGVIGGLIVLVAAINFVTLMTARASRRAVEVGVRKALGAGRRDLFVQFMGEALVSVARRAGFRRWRSPRSSLPGASTLCCSGACNASIISVEPWLLAWLLMVAVAAVVALLAGVYPALVLSAFRPARWC